MREPPASILVVDDEPAIRLTLEALLRRQGYAVTTAATSPEAARLIGSHSFDVLLVDLKLPGGSGLDLAEQMRATHPGTAILILTGSTEFQDPSHDLRLDEFAFLMKTTSPQELLAHVESMVQARRSQHQAG